MGPYPHDAPPATISDDNPMGTDGFEFVEYASTEPEKLCRLFETMGFAAVARHRSKDVTLYRQGDVNFVVNAEGGQLRAPLRRAARAVRLRDGVSRGRCRAMPSSARWRWARSPWRPRSGRWS